MPHPALEIQAAGFELGLTDDGMNLWVSPKSRLTDEIRQFIRSHKPELLAYLKRQHAANDSSIPPCASPDELARMVQHHAQALHAGLTHSEADRATDALLYAAREGVLDMSCCFTCNHLRGTTPARWRCASTSPLNELSGLPLPREFIIHLHRCPSHQPPPEATT